MKTISKLGTLGLGFAFALFGASRPAEAIVITDVVVTIGATTYTAGTVGWSFPYTLLAGQDLVLTQSLNGPPTDSTSYNFDTSDVQGAGDFPFISITVDGVTTVFTDLNQILNLKGIDPINNELNEAQEYGAALNGPGYQVFLGYADNTHTGPCGAWATSIGLLGAASCFPSVFFGATFFDGAGGLNPPVLDQTLPNHCDETQQLANCFEGGVIRIVATDRVPEPATMALLLTGLAVLTARRYGHARKRA